jgi:hypothetical protein
VCSASPGALKQQEEPADAAQQVRLVAACWLGVLCCPFTSRRCRSEGQLLSHSTCRPSHNTLRLLCAFLPCRPPCPVAVVSCCPVAAVWLLLLAAAAVCLPQVQVPVRGHMCLPAHLTACVFTHVWTRSHMHTLATSAPSPFIRGRDSGRVPVSSRPAFAGLSALQGTAQTRSHSPSCVVLCPGV